MPSISKRLSVWAVVVALLLLIPLVLTIRDGGVEGVGWNWTLFDFVFMWILLFGAGLVYELLARKMNSVAYRAAVGLAVLTSVLLVWINGAVGIIGSEDNPANLLYGAVLITGLIGASIARLEPRGMSRTLFATAIAQVLVPVIAFIIWRPDFSPGVLQVFGLNAVFAALWVGSALLFRQAYHAKSPLHQP
jgi:hypothetical protein